jgi:hypothetical protein
MSLVSAEILKLVRRRGTMAWCAILTIGSVVVAYAILVSLHAANPAHHGAAGGRQNLRDLIFLLGGLANVAAILIGSAAGTQDVSSGVFRELVVTGRPRSTLFNVRLPGALAVLYPLVATGFGLAVLGAFAFAGDKPHPTGSELWHYAAYLVSITSVDVAIAIGLSAFASSRVVVGVLIAWNAIVSHVLISITSLGGARKFIDVAAAQHFLPKGANDTAIPMSGAAAILILLAWAGLFQRAGRWWVVRRDA